jgi:hypothetical protein
MIEPLDDFQNQRFAPGAVDCDVSTAPLAKRWFHIDLGPLGGALRKSHGELRNLNFLAGASW